MRSLGLPLISFGLTGAVVANAYYQKKQFYPSVVYITKSNSSMAVIYIQALILVILAGKLVKKIFFGQLRAAEFEHLMERSWYAVTETCLAFTVFKDDFSPKFVALFTLLLFLKAFHWLTEDRVDFMERSPMISYIFHIRIIVLLTVLGLLDLYFVVGAYQTTVTKGASVMIVFGFEYAILLTVCVNILIKYALHTIDLNREIFWESKAVFFLYMELVMITPHKKRRLVAPQGVAAQLMLPRQTLQEIPPHAKVPGRNDTHTEKKLIGCQKPNRVTGFWNSNIEFYIGEFDTIALHNLNQQKAGSVPPPVPPPDFSSLTDEQLRTMESNAREGVEARLRCLHNIQLLLDAATLMLQQYSVAAANVNVANSMTSPPPSSTSAEQDGGTAPAAAHYQHGPDLTTEPQLHYATQEASSSSSSGSHSTTLAPYF
ncbi:E3 ubiquitin-protein ligase synoviolin A-like [Diaphorina citri]|uniref:E3 ubiquitin-protein ligase synoviolin A-like n=2 Tax=Diaphorina citri TaxID=121845 RepID=A0A1S3DBN1_DIACI|nr:E3 ubiquitin-protein ligase synoviolin A-like [Diaphorina citri]